MIDRSGEIIRDYELLELVGNGSFASVYKAKHCLIGRIVAIKIIHPELLDDNESMQRFKAEASIIANLNHPYIVQLNEFWVDDGGAYIVMEWMARKSLREHLDKHAILSPEKVALILSQIAPAFSLVHRKNIIHRDLKPANIMFDEEGDAHIADFGLAKWHAHPTGLSSPNASIGTPAYMPPEQVESSGDDVTGMADVYSLGVILYELLTGQHPFGKGLNVIEMVLHHLRDPLPSIIDVMPDLPHAIDAVIQKATQKNPEDRYQDVLEMADAFQDAIDGTVDFDPIATSLLIRGGEVPPRGEIQAHIYRKAGAVLEKPRKLIGRDDLIESVLRNLADDSRILMHGLGGMGKTSIAATVAANYIEQSGNTVIWIELGKQDEQTFFDAIANTFGQQSAIAGKYGDDRILVIREILLEHDALLVIDNIWNEQAMIPIMRAIPYTMPTLMTSRKLLSIDGILIDIEQLAEQDALQLLEHYAGKSYENDQSAMRLVELLGSHPYAIELAGSRLKIYQHTTPEKVISDMARSPHDTGQLGQVKKASVNDLLDESVGDLTVDLRQLLTLMGGLFTTVTSLDLFAKVAGQDMDSLMENLAELERNGLIRLILDETNLPHYRMHDLTYSYLVFKFTTTFELDRILYAIEWFVEQRSKDYGALDFEMVNILRVIRHFHDYEQHDMALKVIGKLMIDGYVDSRGFSPQLLDQMNKSIDFGFQSPSLYQEDLHFLLTKRGNWHDMANNRELAQYDYERALELAPNSNRKGTLLCVLGGALFHRQQQGYDRYFDEAYEIAIETQDDYLLERIVETRGACALILKQYDVAEDYLSRALSLALKIGDLESIVWGRYNLAITKASLGHNHEALAMFQENCQLGEQENNHYWIALSTSGMGLAYHGMKERILAAECLQTALGLYDDLGDEVSVSWVKDFADEHDYILTDI